MVVGEPTLMGGEFGDEDERLITRLENSQFEPTTRRRTIKTFRILLLFSKVPGVRTRRPQLGAIVVLAPQGLFNPTLRRQKSKLNDCSTTPNITDSHLSC